MKDSISNQANFIKALTTQYSFLNIIISYPNSNFNIYQEYYPFLILFTLT